MFSDLQKGRCTQSLKSAHSIWGTILCMGRCGGMKSPKSPLDITKTTGTPIHIQAHNLIEFWNPIVDATSKYPSHAKKKGCDFSQILVGRSLPVSPASWGCGQSSAVRGKPTNDPRTTPEIILFQDGWSFEELHWSVASSVIEGGHPLRVDENTVGSQLSLPHWVIWTASQV